MRHTDHPTRPPRHLRSVASATTVFAIAFLGFGSAPASAAPGDVAIDVYTMNDFHGRIETTSSTAGAAGVAGAYKSFLATNPNSTLVSAGDNVGASTFVSLVQNDDPTIDALNATGLTVTAIGNHELDKGTADLNDHIIERADYAHISSNLLLKGTNEYAYDPYDLQTFDGVTVGFVGAVTEDLPYLVSPAGIATLDVAPIVESVNTVATALKDGDPANGEADVVVLLIHEGAPTATTSVTDQETAFGKIVTGTGANLDAIASGHTHQVYSSTATVGGKTIPVLQTGSYGTNLGHLAFEVDPDTKVISSATGSLIPLLTAEGELVIPADPDVQAIVDEAVAEAAVVGSEPVGTIGDSFLRATQTDGTENRGGESSIGNFVAEAQLAAVADVQRPTSSEPGAQIAFMNPGGIRQNLDYAASGDEGDGVVTYEEAAIVQPFANTLVTETLTGAQIKTVLEQQWQPAGTSRPFLKLGTNADFAYTYDPSAPVGERIASMSYQGALITAEQTFTVVMNSFLAAGGDNFTEFANGTDVADSGRSDLQALVDYLGSSTEPFVPSGISQSVGITGSVGGVPIDESGVVSIPLSSLLVPGTPDLDTEVVTTFDGVEVARTPIDPSVVDTTDEIGRAAVQFTLPAGTTGEHDVTFTLDRSGFVISGTLLLADEAVEPIVVPIEDPIESPITVIDPIVPPMLAATGVEVGTTVGSGILLLLAGLAMIATRRIRRSE